MKAYQKQVTVTGTPTSPGTASLVDAELSCPTTNSANVTVDINGESRDWLPGESHTFKKIDLDDVLVSGTGPDVFVIHGAG